MLGTDDPKYRPFGFWFRGREDEEKKRATNVRAVPAESDQTGRITRSSGRLNKDDNNARNSGRLNKDDNNANLKKQMLYLQMLTEQYNLIKQKEAMMLRKIQHQERPFGPQLPEKGRNIYRLPDRHSYAWLQPNRDSSDGHTNGYDLVNNGYKTIQQRRNTDYEPGLLGNMEDTPKIVRLENNPGYMMKNDPGTLHSSFSWSDATPQEVASRYMIEQFRTKHHPF